MKKKFLLLMVLSLCLFQLSPFAARAATTLNLSSFLNVGSSFTQGLVGWWTFDGKDTNWTTNKETDESGQGSTASITNLATTTAPVLGKIGQAFTFSGSNTQYVQASGFAGLGTSNQSYTISAWVKPLSASESGDIVHVSQAADGTGWCISMLEESSGKAQAVSWVGTPTTATGATTLLPNVWYHIVHVWSAAGGLQLYVNGVLDASTAQGTFTGSGVSDFVTIGAPASGSGCSTDTGTGFAGAIDDARVYTRALTAAEIVQLYKNGATKAQSSTGLNNGTSLSSSLVGWWTLDGKDTNWTTNKETDESGQGNTGVFTSLSTTTSPVLGKLGQAMKFDGSTQYIQSASPYTSVTNWTLSAWIKPATLPQLSLAIYNGNDAGGYGFGVGTGAGGSGSKLQVLFGSVSWLDPSFSLTAGQWYHVVMTRDSSTTRVYVNGAQLATTFANTPGSVVNKFTVGMQPDGSSNPGRFFNGTVDDARIYNRTLTAAEVKQLYQFGADTANAPSPATQKTGLASGLAALWTFDGKDTNWATNVEADESGSGNTASLSLMGTTTSPGIGKMGQAMKFNGTSNSITTAYTIPAQSSATSFTWSTWAKLPTGNASNVVIMGFRNGATWIKITPTNFEYASGSIIAYTVPTGSWVHLVVVKSGSSFTYYENGSVVGSASNSSSAVSQALYLGEDPGFPSDGFFSGSLDDVRVYTRALSAAEVLQLYRLGK